MVIAMTLAVIRLSQRREYQARNALDAALTITIPESTRRLSPAPDHVDSPARSRQAARHPASTLAAHRRRGGTSAARRYGPRL
ncbi:MAG TPA: hypothetical protein VGG75_41800 [Trebonia sp.]